MKRFLVLLTAIILMQSVLFSMTATVAFAQETQATAFVSGAVYRDANENGMAEPNEQNLAGAIVSVRAVDGTLYTAVTNEYGFYLVNNLPQGDYQVWALDANGNRTSEVAVSLGEVNAAVALDLGVIDNSDDVELTAIRQVFIPMVNR
jgi:hypothetical protein